jgi:hypothetical protein
MNEQNLKPFTQMTESEQRKIASMGGKASAEARRKKKLMREVMQDCLDETITLKNGDEITARYALAKKHLQKGIAGDAKSAKLVIDWSGEAPTRNEFTGEDGAPLRITIENIDKLYDELRSDKD